MKTFKTVEILLETELKSATLQRATTSQDKKLLIYNKFIYNTKKQLIFVLFTKFQRLTRIFRTK